MSERLAQQNSERLFRAKSAWAVWTDGCPEWAVSASTLEKSQLGWLGWHTQAMIAAHWQVIELQQWREGWRKVQRVAAAVVDWLIPSLAEPNPPFL